MVIVSLSSDNKIFINNNEICNDATSFTIYEGILFFTASS